jgi:hypothetical protein
LALKRFELAKYKCEANQKHSLFLSRASGKPFLEAHHVIPVSLAEHFKGKQLDSIDNIVALCPHCHRAVHHAQSDQTIHILENWLKKNTTSTGKKPKMLFVCTSGGGQRAATWTVNTLQTLDSATNFKISKQTQLMSGASGGLIGAAYYRELYLRKITQGINPCDRKYYNNMAKDVLNPVIFNMVVNDFIFRFKHFSDGKYTYAKDRGFAFEKHLNDNLDSVLSKPLLSYRDPEKNSQIPMLLIAPTITNDGRKLYISPQNISFMNNASPCVQSKLNQRVKGVEFLRVFKNQDAK